MGLYQLVQEKRREIRERAAMKNIDTYAVQGPGAFQTEELIQAWFLRHLQIIGAANRFWSQSLKDSHAAIPRSKIIGMGPSSVHDYFDLDLPLVWNVAERELPELQKPVTVIFTELEGS